MMCYSGKCSADDASIIQHVRLLIALRKNGSHNPRQYVAGRIFFLLKYKSKVALITKSGISC